MAEATKKQVAFRFTQDLIDRVAAAAEDRDVSINWLVTRLVEEGLERILPTSEFRLTKPSHAAEFTDMEAAGGSSPATTSTP